MQPSLSGRTVVSISNDSSSSSKRFDRLITESAAKKYADAVANTGGGGSYWQSSSSNNIDNNNTGNVGIGLSNPIYKLDVSGDINLTGNLYKNGQKWLHTSGANGNFFGGTGAGASNLLGSFNLGFGYEALNKANNADLQNNIAIGFQAMKNSSGTGPKYNSIAIGANALDSLEWGYSPIAIGKLNNFRYKTGTGLVSLGASVNSISGDFNTFIGSDQFQFGSGLVGNFNTTLGGQIANNKTTGYSNVYVGFGSAVRNISGDNSTYVGFYSGSRGNDSYSTYLGAFAGARSSGNLRVIIDGLDRGDSTGEVNNALIIGQMNFAGALYQSLKINGSTTINGPGTVTESLTVKGAIKLGNVSYSGLSNGATSPVPVGGGGIIVFESGHFFGWNGSSWRQLDN
jgi:hypothetical protein